MADWGIALSHWGNPFAGCKPAQHDRTRPRRSIDTARHDRHADPARARLHRRRRPAHLRDRSRHTRGAHRRLRVGDGDGVARQSRRRRSAHLLRAGGEPDRVASRQDLRQEPARRPASSEPLFTRRCRRIPGWRTTSSTPTTRRRWPTARCRRPAKYASLAPAIPHALHMPSHTFTRVGCGRNRSRPTAARPRRHALPRAAAKNCTRSTTRPTPTCSWRRMLPPDVS